MSVVAKGTMVGNREGTIMAAGNTLNLQYMNYIWCAN